MLKSFKFVVLKFVVHICNKVKTNESQRVKEYGIAFPMSICCISLAVTRGQGCAGANQLVFLAECSGDTLSLCPNLPLYALCIQNHCIL